MEQEQNNSKELSIELDEKTMDGHYANLVVVNHSQSEFVLDFISVMPGSPKGRVKSRVVMSPLHIYSLVKNLQENLQEYEQEGKKNEKEQSEVITLPVVGNWEA